MLRASRRLRLAFFWVTASMLCLLVVVGCAGGGEGEQEQEKQDQQPEEELAPVTKVTADHQYAGRVEGTDAFIGVAIREQTDELIAYVCNGPPEGPPEAATIEAWFQGPIENDEASLSADGGEERLQALLTPEAAAGTFVDVEGQAYIFEAEQVDVEGDAGLYWSEPLEGEGLSSRDGTIVLADGEERGKRGRYITVLR